MTIFKNSTVIILEQNAIFFQWNNFFGYLTGPPASTFDAYQSLLNAASTKVILISCKMPMSFLCADPKVLGMI